jgi:type IV fimbrial biogenesis protein FimT
MSTSPKRTEYGLRGFTLIELMVTISVLAILLAIAIPNLREFVLRNRVSSDVNGFIGLVNYARSEAIVRNQDVVVCPKTNGAITCVSNGMWGQFEIQAFVDVNGNGQRNGGDILLKTIPATDSTGLQREITRKVGSGSTVTAGVISFSAGGYSQTAHRFDINPIGDTALELQYGRSVCVSKPGRVRVSATGPCV